MSSDELEAARKRVNRWQDSVEDRRDVPSQGVHVASVFARFCRTEKALREDPHQQRAWVAPEHGRRLTHLGERQWHEWVSRLELNGWLRETRPAKRGPKGNASEYALEVAPERPWRTPSRADPPPG